MKKPPRRLMHIHELTDDFSQDAIGEDYNEDHDRIDFLSLYSQGDNDWALDVDPDTNTVYTYAFCTDSIDAHNLTRQDLKDCGLL